MEWDYGDGGESFSADGPGLFICNEGNFQYGNGTLSFYTPSSAVVENEVFYRANGYRLGDVIQSMTLHKGKGWIVANNSNVIWAIDAVTLRETGRIQSLTSPRYIHFVSDTKAYVTQLWDNRIFIVDPTAYAITGYISVPGMEMESGSTEQMVQLGKYVYCTCWSYQNSIIRIDTETDTVDGSLTVGIQPRSIALDCNGKLWVLTDGGYEGSPYGYEAPLLVKIDPETFTLERRYPFKLGDTPSELQLNAAGDTLYWINDNVWRMDVRAEFLPSEPFIQSRGTRYYALSVSPYDSDVYVADAIDYQQQGIVYRYKPDGTLADSFYAGVIPGFFCWK